MANLSTRQIGKVGELIGQRYLESKGYKYVSSNWHCQYGEIDLIFVDKSTLVFAEVKYVTNTNYCRAVELFNDRKRAHLRRTIQIFLNKYTRYLGKWRADLVCITRDTNKFWVQHYSDIFNDG